MSTIGLFNDLTALTAIQKMHYGSIKSNALWDIAQFLPFICTQYLIQFCAQIVASSFIHISRTVYRRDLIQIGIKLHIFLYSAYCLVPTLFIIEV